MWSLFCYKTHSVCTCTVLYLYWCDHIWNDAHNTKQWKYCDHNVLVFQFLVMLFFCSATFFNLQALLLMLGVIMQLKIALTLVALLYLKVKRPDLPRTVSVSVHSLSSLPLSLFLSLSLSLSLSLFLSISNFSLKRAILDQTFKHITLTPHGLNKKQQLPPPSLSV